MQYMLCCGVMAGEEAPDKIIREREFKLPSGINIDNLDFPTEVEPVGNPGIDSEKKDEAIGDVFDPFSEPREDSPGKKRG